MTATFAVFRELFSLLLLIQMGELTKAVQAAYTYLVRNPNDTEVGESMKFFMEQKDFDFSMIKDLEERPYTVTVISVDFRNKKNAKT